MGIAVLRYKGADSKGFETATEARKATEEFVDGMNKLEVWKEPKIESAEITS
jgi:hypothetical protein